MRYKSMLRIDFVHWNRDAKENAKLSIGTVRNQMNMPDEIVLVALHVWS